MEWMKIEEAKFSSSDDATIRIRFVITKKNAANSIEFLL